MGAAGGATAGVILAAGGGARLGGHPKALLTCEGERLVERAIRAARAGGCGDVLVVLGCDAARVAATADLTGARVAVNEAWATGIGSSLRTALDGLARTRANAALTLLVDQPFVGAAAVRAVLGAHAGAGSLAMADYAGRRGHPVLLGRDHWTAAAASATGDRGARAYLSARRNELVLVPCGGLGDPADLDEPADLARYGIGLE